MKNTTTYILIGAILLVGFIVFNNKNSAQKVYTYDVPASTNLTTEGDKQIVEIKAKGGYAPAMTTAKAGVPTIIRVQTNGTFDCSTALRIPDLKYSKNLPATGTTDIEVPAQEAGTTLSALCSMGMYHFKVQFNS